jgi:hypothetical protein
MRRNKMLLVASAGILLVLAGNVMGNPTNCAPECAPYGVRQNTVKAPEIDVTSGGSAIVLLVTTLLLVAERSRRT